MRGAAPLLSYSAPRCFLEREYRYRSVNAILSVVLLLCFAGFATFVGVKAGTIPGLALTFPRFVIFSFATGCAAWAAWIVFNALRNTVLFSRVTEEGIEVGGKLYAWRDIERIGGACTPGGILMRFQLRDRKGFWPNFERAVMTTPPLSRAEFDAVIGALQGYLGENHPHVLVSPEPRSDPHVTEDPAPLIRAPRKIPKA